MIRSAAIRSSLAGLVFTSLLLATLVVLAGRRSTVIAAELASDIRREVMRDMTEVDVLSSSIEGMSDISATEFRIAASGIFTGETMIDALMLARPGAVPPGAADDVFALAAGHRTGDDPADPLIRFVEPRTPETVLALGHPFSELTSRLIDAPASSMGGNVPIRALFGADSSFGTAPGSAILVRRVIRVAPDGPAEAHDTVDPRNVRAVVIGRIRPQDAMATHLDVPWASGEVWYRGSGGRTGTCGPLARSVPIAFDDLPLEGVIDVDLAPLASELFVGLLVASCGALLTTAIAGYLTSHRRTLDVARRRLEIATDGAGIGVWEIDNGRGASIWDDRALAMHQIDSVAATDIDAWIESVHPDDRRCVASEFRRAVDARSRFDARFRVVSADGTCRFIHATATAWLDEVTGTVRMVGASRDITGDIEREAALVEARDSAEAASRAKSDFLANMSHEIRTPMTAILGYVDLLSGDLGRDPDGSADAVRTIRSNADHLMTIINDILDVSKIEAGQMTVESLDVDPIRMVDDVAALIRPRAAGKGLGLEIVHETPLPTRITSDPTRLRQIILNLTGNAVKFTETGSVEIGVSCDRVAQTFSIRISDTGIGMTPDQRDHIARFEAFAQADESMTRRFGGTGLGLRISHGLVQILGGTIAIESSPGRGSTFTVTLPAGHLASGDLIAPEDIAGHLAASPHEDGEVMAAIADSDATPLAGLRILLAEDGPDNQRLIGFHLKKAGATVVVCDNGLIAAETIEQAAAEERPDVVLMDMQMPELDGYGATRRLRDGGFDLPIIALTAHAMDGDRERCLDAGCNEYTTKPINRDTLVRMCRDFGIRSNRRAA